MIASLLLGVQTPTAYTKFISDDHQHGAEHRAVEQVLAGMRAIDVDSPHPKFNGIDVIGSPILFVDDEILAAFDRTVDNDSKTVVTNDSDDEDSDDGEDDLDRDWPLFVRGTSDQANEMHLGIFGGCSSTVRYAELERQRVREPIESISFYL